MAVFCARPRVLVGAVTLLRTCCVYILARSCTVVLYSVGQVLDVGVNRKVSNAVTEYLR